MKTPGMTAYRIRSGCFERGKVAALYQIQRREAVQELLNLKSFEQTPTQRPRECTKKILRAAATLLVKKNQGSILLRAETYSRAIESEKVN